MPVDQLPAASPPTKPKGFSAVIGLSMTVAILGILASLGGLGGALFVEKAPWLALQPASAGPQTERMRELQTLMLQASVTPWGTILYLIALPVAVWVLVSVWQMSKRRRGASSGFALAIGVLAAVEVAFLALQVSIHLRTRQLMDEMVKAMAETDPRLPAGFNDVMGSIMQVSMIAATVFTFVWGFGKIGYCLYAQHYARKPAVRAWVDGPPAF
jgi:hypothetical protein